MSASLVVLRRSVPTPCNSLASGKVFLVMENTKLPYKSLQHVDFSQEKLKVLRGSSRPVEISLRRKVSPLRVHGKRTKAAPKNTLNLRYLGPYEHSPWHLYGFFVLQTDVFIFWIQIFFNEVDIYIYIYGTDRRCVLWAIWPPHSITNIDLAQLKKKHCWDIDFWDPNLEFWKIKPNFSKTRVGHLEGCSS